MGKYQSFHATGIGSSHVKRGIGCEDFSGSISTEQYHIAAVADGHGDPSCFRSSAGSKYAVNIAIESLESFAKNIYTHGMMAQMESVRARENMIRQLGNCIVGKWSLTVMEDLRENPITEQELELAQNYAEAYRRGDRLEHIYGTTLIAALLTPDFLLVFHQGDGRCVVIHEDGVIDQPVPWDNRCHDNVTTSMCNSDAAQSIRSYFLPLDTDHIIACYCATDGVEDSFETQKQVNAYFAKTTCNAYDIGMEQFVKEYEDYLPAFSASGSGDDISISGIIDLEAVEKFYDTFATMSKVSDSELLMNKAKSRLGSMERKRRILKERYEESCRIYEASKESVSRNQTLLDRVMEMLASAKKDYAQSEQALAEAAEKMQKTKAELDEYMEQYHHYEEIYQQNNDVLNASVAKLARIFCRLRDPAGENPQATEEANDEEESNADTDKQNVCVKVGEPCGTALEEDIAECVMQKPEPTDNLSEKSEDETTKKDELIK